MTCEYGQPELCGKPATWRCGHDRVPFLMYACDQHAPLMGQVELARRLPDAPPMDEPYLRAYVTALAWVALLASDKPESLRAANNRAAFRLARDEYQRRFPTEYAARIKWAQR